jgi:hypothetical protein
MSRADNGYATHQQPHQIDDELMQSDGGGEGCAEHVSLSPNTARGSHLIESPIESRDVLRLGIGSDTQHCKNVMTCGLTPEHSGALDNVADRSGHAKRGHARGPPPDPPIQATHSRDSIGWASAGPLHGD